MFSNDVKTALENSIIDFNISLQTKTFKMTDYDLKNMFFQCLRKHLKSTNYFSLVCKGYLEFKCLTKFEIKDGCLINLKFDQWNIYNKNVEAFLDELNYNISLLNFEELNNRSLAVNNISITFDSFINKLNSIKIK